MRDSTWQLPCHSLSGDLLATIYLGSRYIILTFRRPILTLQLKER